MDTLWPDTEGDKARRALDTTLHRFRKLAGYDQIIEVKDRKLSLNDRLCWLDIWDIERLLKQLEILLVNGEQECEQGMKLKQQLVLLYTGRFLSDDNSPDCIIGCRNHLHHRCMNRLGQLGLYLEKHLEWHQAVSVYQQILEMDDRQELIYQHLIKCFQNQGLIAEAISVYERCREALSIHFDIPPSATTKALYNSLR